jgi:hypothetical protein
MPRGVYDRKAVKSNKNVLDKAMNISNVRLVETDEQIIAKLSERFEVLGDMTQAAIDGDVRALIVSGPAGLGKSHDVETILSKNNISEDNIVKGYIKATGLFKLLYQHRNKGNILVLDDADSVFFDDISLSFLKAVLDTNDRRTVSYLSEGILIDDETSERLPKSFKFDGTIIFITNLDFDDMIMRGHKLAPHLQALVSRAHYISLEMKTVRDYLIRIRMKMDEGILNNILFNPNDQKDVMNFIEENHTNLRELSLRMALKIATIRRKGGNWKKMARVTCCRPS